MRNSPKVVTVLRYFLIRKCDWTGSGEGWGGGAEEERGDSGRGPLRSEVRLFASITMLCRRVLSPPCPCGKSMHFNDSPKDKKIIILQRVNV